MQPLIDAIDARLDTLYSRLAKGHDAPPALRLRLEGLLEAALLVGAASEEELQRRLAQAHARHFTQSLEDRFSVDWRATHPFPQIPAYMERAPVSPTTRD